VQATPRPVASCSRGCRRPRPADRRSRFYFAPSRIHERREIRELHRRGLHYVGDWHTHPEPVPSPSSLDLRNIREIFTQSRHAYAGILIVIVGQLEPPTGIFVGIANGQQIAALVPLPATEAVF
jgi:integrative and conjugative element protein (TIGR02256 family)